MFINESVLIQIHILILVSYLIFSPNILTSWYCGGLYLLSGGLLLLLGEGGIFIGFLWVIDFGVGVIFLLFIVSNSSFVHLTNVINIISFKNIIPFILSLFILFWPYFDFFLGSDINFFFPTFLLSWYNFWEIYHSLEITDLNLLREIFFIHESWEFFLINFIIIYGLMGSIFFFFLGKRFIPLKKNWNRIAPVFSLFIRSQDLIKQQRVSSTVRHWEKSHNNNSY